MRAFVRQRLASLAFPPRIAQEISLAVNEACANVIRHTNSQDAQITFLIDREQIAIEIRDSGVFRKPAPLEVFPERGWGIPIMRSVMDSVLIHEGTSQSPGTVVRLVKMVPGWRPDSRSES
jgi:anti-sigma regulatory factor (Ser/Thr protein kinase)